MHGGLENAKQTFLRLVKNSIYAHNISFIHSLCFNNQSALKYTTVQNKIKSLRNLSDLFIFLTEKCHWLYRSQEFVSWLVNPPRLQFCWPRPVSAVGVCSVFGHLGGKPTGRQPTGRQILDDWATRFGQLILGDKAITITETIPISSIKKASNRWFVHIIFPYKWLCTSYRVCEIYAIFQLLRASAMPKHV